jgi:hypothetical protein
MQRLSPGSVRETDWYGSARAGDCMALKAESRVGVFVGGDDELQR